MHYDEVKHALYPNTADVEDFTYERVRRLLDFVRGREGHRLPRGRGLRGCSPTGCSLISPGLGDRLWYGGASLSSARWAGDHAMNFLTSSVVKAEESEDFAEIQLSHIRAFRERHPDGDRARVSQGLVVIPTDTASADQRAKYKEFADEAHPAHRDAPGPGPPDVRARPRRHLRRDRRTPPRPRGLPGDRRGRLRPPVHLRPRRLRADPHRHGHPPGPGPRLAGSFLEGPHRPKRSAHTSSTSSTTHCAASACTGTNSFSRTILDHVVYAEDRQDAWEREFEAMRSRDAFLPTGVRAAVRCVLPDTARSDDHVVASVSRGVRHVPAQLRTDRLLTADEYASMRERWLCSAATGRSVTCRDEVRAALRALRRQESLLPGRPSATPPGTRPTPWSSSTSGTEGTRRT